MFSWKISLSWIWQHLPLTCCNLHLSSQNVVIKTHQSKSGWQDDQDCHEKAARYCWWLVQKSGTNHLGCGTETHANSGINMDKLPICLSTVARRISAINSITGGRAGIFSIAFKGPKKRTFFGTTLFGGRINSKRWLWKKLPILGSKGTNFQL